MSIQFFWFLVAQAVSQAGTAASTTGLGILWALGGGSGLQLALILAIPAVPSVLVALFVGAAVERVALRPFLVAANVALCAIALALAWAIGLPAGRTQLALLITLFILKEVGVRAFNAGYNRAFGALSPATNGPSVVLTDLTYQAGIALGASIGGQIAPQGGNLVFMIDAASFVVAGVITLFLSLPGRAAPRSGSPVHLVRDARLALRYMVTTRRVLLVFGAYCAMSLSYAAWDISSAYLFIAAGQPEAAGTANTAAQIGKMTAGFWMLGLGLSFTARKVMIASLVMAVTGIVGGLIGLCGPGGVVVTLLIAVRAIFGAAAYLGGGGAHALLVTNAPKRMRARMSSLVGSVGAGLVAGGSKLGVGALNDAIGPALAILVPSVLGTSLSLRLCGLERRHSRRGPLSPSRRRG